jgi:hypothetical protein
MQRLHQRHVAADRNTAAPTAPAPPSARACATATPAASGTAAGVSAVKSMQRGAPLTAPTGPQASTSPPGLPNNRRIELCPESHRNVNPPPIDRCPCCEGRGVAIRCTGCDGQGIVVVRTEREATQTHLPTTERCLVCRGHGYWPISHDLAVALGFEHA